MYCEYEHDKIKLFSLFFLTFSVQKSVIRRNHILEIDWDAYIDLQYFLGISGPKYTLTLDLHYKKIHKKTSFSVYILLKLFYRQS